jgi:phosphate-selective porin OprO and OprP
MTIDSDTFKNQSGQLAGQTGADAVPTLAQSYADPTFSAKKAKSWTAGVKWYMNSNAKFELNYEQT